MSEITVTLDREAAEDFVSDSQFGAAAFAEVHRSIRAALDAQEVQPQALEPVGEVPVSKEALDWAAAEMSRERREKLLRDAVERLEGLADHAFPSIAEEMRAEAQAIKSMLPMKLKITGGGNPAGMNDQIYAHCQPEGERESTEEELSGAELIAAERRRQVTAEGWTPDHDDEHDSGELVDAAGCYLKPGEFYWTARAAAPPEWPWDRDAWKPALTSGGPESIGWPTPEDTVRNLTKAGALIAAEIDRLQRATQSEQSHTE